MSGCILFFIISLHEIGDCTNHLGLGPHKMPYIVIRKDETSMYGYPGYGYGCGCGINTFVLIVVLFILLIIVGATFIC
ncbi:YjcZ family sporulation protein [Bacillus tequilensis]|uniref:YjcZ family sporulation protein n=1 Tax=Bacillus tequilensis TaxID=227866 RepID=A0A6H0WNS8_9BACI|nr:YjcZ family sporulation protein [Bacillus tequilensis]MDR4435392.1 YjcZ family sporulation protein [Bacillus tequilensis]QIW80345.1 YjcZ family sporulation protein [Bacillus tequilensis]